MKFELCRPTFYRFFEQDLKKISSFEQVVPEIEKSFRHVPTKSKSRPLRRNRIQIMHKKLLTLLSASHAGPYMGF